MLKKTERLQTEKGADKIKMKIEEKSVIEASNIMVEEEELDKIKNYSYEPVKI